MSQLANDLITFIVSVAGAMFVSGYRFGKLQGDVENIKDDLKEIKGMFTLKLKE